MSARAETEKGALASGPDLFDALFEAGPGYDERRRRADYRLVFGSEAGRRVLADLARFAHLGHPSYVRGDALETAFREGERNAVLRILSLLRERRPAQRSAPAAVSEETEQQQ